jgi:hypothetical protein
MIRETKADRTILAYNKTSRDIGNQKFRFAALVAVIAGCKIDITACETATLWQVVAADGIWASSRAENGFNTGFCGPTMSRFSQPALRAV